MPELPPRLQQWRSAFGTHLRTIREQRGLSQEALAEQAGLDRQMVYRTELGQTSPRVDALVRLADVLGIEPRQLLPTFE